MKNDIEIVFHTMKSMKRLMMGMFSHLLALVNFISRIEKASHLKIFASSFAQKMRKLALNIIGMTIININVIFPERKTPTRNLSAIISLSHIQSVLPSHYRLYEEDTGDEKHFGENGTQRKQDTSIVDNYQKLYKVR